MTKYIDDETFKKMSIQEKADYIRRYMAENPGVPKFFIHCHKCPKCSTLWEAKTNKCPMCGADMRGEING